MILGKPTQLNEAREAIYRSRFDVRLSPGRRLVTFCDGVGYDKRENEWCTWAADLKGRTTHGLLRKYP
jgi:hypothetical protein